MINYKKLLKSSSGCPICEQFDFEILAKNDRYGMGVQTVGCRHCGLIQTWPRPTKLEMDNFYKNHYRKYYQTTSLPDESYIKKFSKHERLSYTANLIKIKTEFNNNARILDIGCAEGTLLFLLRQHCETLSLFGIEPNRSFAEYAEQTSGCQTYPSLEEIRDQVKSGFDLIIVNHVFEHISEPVSFLIQLKSLLNSNGKVFIDVPDVAKYSSPQDLHIAHLFHFSKKSLKNILNKAGFNVLELFEHKPPHHPPSIIAIININNEASIEKSYESFDDHHEWDNVKNINPLLKYYLFKQWIYRNKYLKYVLWLYRMFKSRFNDTFKF